MPKTTYFIAVIIIIGLLGVAFTVPIFPVTVKESYQVQVPYTVEVEVTKTKTVCDYACNLDSFTFKTKDFSLTSARLVKISWRSDEDVNLFAVMTDDAWDSFKNKLIIKLGLPAVATILSGGTLTAYTIPVMLSYLPDVLNIISSENYYKRNAKSGFATKNWDSGSYKILVIGIDCSGNLDADITYDYQTTEMQTRYRTETKTEYNQKKVTFFEYLTNNY